MKIRFAIIEDEPFTAEDLAEDILRIRPNWVLDRICGSVTAARQYLGEKPNIDLVFCDVELGDGTCFDLFDIEQPSVPVIFCTAYDSHALKAFETNGIAYVLKPFSVESLEKAVAKFEQLILKETKPGPGERLMVQHRGKVVPLAFPEVALFYLHHELVRAACFDGRNFPLDESLTELSEKAGDMFFRADRQNLVNKEAVAGARHVGRKLELELRVTTEEKVQVSKEKATAFLQWLAQGR